ncbi:MAG: hypothetical protein ACE5LH_01355 [Fidelibacterota bacterium]
MTDHSDTKFKVWLRDLLELAILIAFLMFLAVIYIPRSIWEEEESVRNESRFRMENVYDVLTFYERLTGTRTDDGLWALRVVNATRDSLTADSTFLGEQTVSLPEGEITVDIRKGTDADYDTTFGFLKTRKDTVMDTVFSVVSYSAVDDRYDTTFIRLEDIRPYLEDPSVVDIPDTSVTSHVEVVSYYETYMPDSSMFVCPLTRKPYIIEATDEVLKVESPIQEPYRERRYLLFAFRADSHGKIENGEKSWVRF